MIFHHIEKCADQLIVLYCNDVIYIFLYIWKYFFSHTLNSRAICNSISAWQRYRLTCFQRRLQACCSCRLNADHFDLGIQHFCKSRYTSDESAPAYRYQNIIYCRKFLDDLHSNRPLSCCYFKIIERMNECQSFFLCQLQCICAGIIIDIPMEYHLCAITLGPVYLDKRRYCRHYNGCPAAEFLCCKSNTLCVISGRSCNQAPLSFLFRHCTDLIISTSHFISPGILHIFRLQVNPAACLPA